MRASLPIADRASLSRFLGKKVSRLDAQAIRVRLDVISILLSCESLSDPLIRLRIAYECIRRGLLHSPIETLAADVITVIREVSR